MSLLSQNTTSNDSCQSVSISSRESIVRSYSRSFPVCFAKAKGSYMYDVSGGQYLDFLAGCGSLNYGHNNEYLKGELLKHIQSDGISMSLDLLTDVRQSFIDAFQDIILKPRHFNYRMQFPGPTGANAVEAAIKLARKVTGRSNVIAFTNAFHGCTLGALALTGSSHHRASSTNMLGHVFRAPYDGYHGEYVDTSEHLRRMILDASSGVDSPAAIVLETVQGEGGLNRCSREWVQKIQAICREVGALLIVDDIQAGCGRTGHFFSFESLGIEPDIICLAKGISGYGLPMSLVLIRPEYDQWAPGEHNGTFRGNNLAFVTAAKAIKSFWSDTLFTTKIQKLAEIVSVRLDEMVEISALISQAKGIGLMQGLEFFDPNVAKRVQEDCFLDGLIIELCGPNDEVLKLLPPLNISMPDIEKGLAIIEKNILNYDSDLLPNIQKSQAVSI